MTEPSSPALRSDRAAALLLVAAAVLVGSVFFLRFTAATVVLGRLVQPAAAALLVVAASVGCGNAGLRLARLAAERLGRLPRQASFHLVDELLIGATIYGTLLSILATGGLIHPLLVAGVTLVAAGWGAVRIREAATAARLPVSVSEALLLAPPIAVGLMGAVTPVNSPDELVYKLAVPRTYELFGRMLELPLNSDSYFPSAIYMADLGAMTLGTGIAAKLFHFALFLASLAVIRRLAASLSERGAPWITAVIAWTPALMIISGWAWAEWAMIGLMLLSIERWQRFVDEPGSADLAVSAAALGAALATKYTALPWLVVFLPIAFVRLRASEKRGAILGAAALITAVSGGFFYARNLLWTGSPVAPFLLPMSPAIANYRSSASGWVELLRGYDIFHEGIIDDSLGIIFPAMVLLSPAALLRRDRRITDLFVIGIVQFFGLVTLAPTSRLMLLALVPLAILGGLAAARLWEAGRRASRALLGTGAALALFGQLLLVGVVFVTSWNFIPYLVGVESEAAYIRRTRDFYVPYVWIGEHTSPGAKFLLLGENRPYYLPRRAIAAGNLDGPRVAAWLGRFPDPQALAAGLKRDGYTHLLVHKPWYRVMEGTTSRAAMLEKEYLLEVPPATDAVLKSCIAQYAQRVYEDRNFVIFALAR